MPKKILGRYGTRESHWVGDGFPVRSLFSYGTLGSHVSPFLLLDYAGPHRFEPTTERRGVGAHPHRGFETVTIVYEGEVAHRDSTGGGGVIGPGDVQWMTAASGILHEEYHSPGFARTGGPFRMVQLWVNLRAADKNAPSGYQAITATTIPVVDLADGAGSARIIAGSLAGTTGPARTFTPMNVWDVRLRPGGDTVLALPEDHTAMLVVVAGRVTVNGELPAEEAQMVLLERQGRDVAIAAEAGAQLLVMTGEPIDEPIVGQGPFVMNSQAEIRAAIEDFRRGRFGRMAA